METLINYISEPWPWWISGPLLGTIVPILLVLKHQFGVSSIFKHICKATGIGRSVYFQYSLREQLWQIFFVIGIILSGIIFHQFNMETGELSTKALNYFKNKEILPNGLFPVDLFKTIPFTEIGLLLTGGFLIGFGSRYANGCTSGHAITGLSLLSPGSLFAVIGFFLGGILGTYLILDLLL